MGGTILQGEGVVRVVSFVSSVSIVKLSQLHVSYSLVQLETGLSIKKVPKCPLRALEALRKKPKQRIS